MTVAVIAIDLPEDGPGLAEIRGAIAEVHHAWHMRRAVPSAQPRATVWETLHDAIRHAEIVPTPTIRAWMEAKVAAGQRTVIGTKFHETIEKFVAEPKLRISDDAAALAAQVSAYNYAAENPDEESDEFDPSDVDLDPFQLNEDEGSFEVHMLPDMPYEYAKFLYELAQECRRRLFSFVEDKRREARKLRESNPQHRWPKPANTQSILPRHMSENTTYQIEVYGPDEAIQVHRGYVVENVRNAILMAYPGSECNRERFRHEEILNARTVTPEEVGKPIRDEPAHIRPAF